MPFLKGKVAQILNSRELVINIGVNDGVCVGMFFNVVNPKGEDIVDPDTHAIIGSLQRPKVKVKVTAVYEKMAVASTYKLKEINIGGSGSSSFASAMRGMVDLSKELTPPNWIKVPETLKTKEKAWEDLDEKESYVKIGDPVIQTLGDTDSSL